MAVTNEMTKSVPAKSKETEHNQANGRFLRPHHQNNTQVNREQSDAMA